jgi:chromosome segregation ATPase
MLYHYKCQLNNKKKQLRNAEAIVVPEPFDLVAFEEELSKLELEINDLQCQINQINTDSIDLKSTFEKAKAERDKWELEVRNQNNKYDEVNKNYKQLEENRVTQNETIAYYKKHLDEILVKINDKDKYIEQQQTELEVNINKHINII